MLGAGGITLFFIQLRVMLLKGVKLQMRYWQSTLAQIVIGPFIFMLVLALLQEGYANDFRNGEQHPSSYDVFAVPNCIVNLFLIGYPTNIPSQNGKCVSIMYTPKNTLTTSIMRALARRNLDKFGSTLNVEEGVVLTDPTVEISKSYDIVPVSSASFIYDYVSNFKNQTQFAVTFDSIVNSGVTNHRYQVWYNYTLTSNFTSYGTDVYAGIFPIMRALDEAIITAVNSPDLSVMSELNVLLKDWPKVPPRVIPDSVVSSLGSTFFFCSTMIVFVSFLTNLVSEKEMKLKMHMEMIGLLTSVYWISWTVDGLIIVSLSSLVTVALGVAFGFSVFANTNFGILWITFFLFGMAMVFLAFFISSLCKKSRTAALVGIFVFVIGLLFQSFVFSNSLIGYIWWDEPTGSAGWACLMFVPFFNFGKVFLDISTMTVGKFDMLTETYVAGPGFGWGSLLEKVESSLLPVYSSDRRQPNVPPPIQSWYFLLMNIVVYGILAIYLDQVLPNEFGYRKSPIFFLKASYWGFKQSDTPVIQTKEEPSDSEETENVQKERVQALDIQNSNHPVKIINLTKMYTSGLLSNQKGFLALNRACLALNEGELFALLGQNGAGKSTMMNILAGLLAPTSGEAIIYGQYLTQDMQSILRDMGCCPQHDVLFPDLTAREHVQLYAGLKGIDSESISLLMEERLATVRLKSVANEVSRTFSGGMKRRLSLILSTIGDPKVLYLDEPTTGMDPVNRRHVWSFIENFKKKAVVILTSHSMEEVEVLGDRIGVMVKGKLRAIGNPVQLRHFFGSGLYRISVVCSSTDAPRLKEKFREMIPSAHLEDDSAGALLYQISHEDGDKISGIVSWLEENPEKNVNGWGMSQTTLEEVFLRIVRHYAGEITDPTFAQIENIVGKKSRTSL